MRIHRFRKLFLFFFLIFFFTCLGPQKGMYPPQESDSTKIVYVINQGWHTGIIFQRENIDTTLWRAIKYDFSASKYIEIGWGDAEFYQAEETSVWMGMKALFWPTGTVLHVARFNRPVEEYFTGYQIYKIALTDSGFSRLCTFMDCSYARDKNGNIIPLGPGLYGDSQFYQARGKYFFTKTCNTWISQALREAGCPITPAYACTASNAFHQIGKFGEKVGEAQ
jgi:uncharacterized protein (TIGR02117 family)